MPGRKLLSYPDKALYQMLMSHRVPKLFWKKFETPIDSTSNTLLHWDPDASA